MEWILYALYAAVMFGVLSVIAKKVMQDTPAIIYTVLYSILGLIFYTPVFIYFSINMNIDPTSTALMALGASMVGNILGFLVYNYSVKKGELSRVVPITRLTPIFTAVIAAIVLGEQISISLGTGIILATTGAIIVLKEEQISYIKSVEKGFHTKAVKAALLSALIYGITSVADRYATQIIQPEIYNFFIFLALTTGLSSAAYIKYQNPVQELNTAFSEHKILYILTGLIAATSTLSIFKAFSMATAAQVTTAIQFQVLIPVIAGVTIFNEGGLKRKIIGSIILVMGIALTTV